MPFLIKHLPKGHPGHEYEHWMLYNLTKKKLGKQHFKTLQAAINSAKNAIQYREKKKSKVINFKKKKYVIPVGMDLKDILHSS
jgi:hypothetical protein